MSRVFDFLKTIAPMPWAASLDTDDSRWGLTVVAGDGRNVSDRQMDRDEARFLCALHAIAPDAMQYVEGAASKGGAAAAEILSRFERMAYHDQTPEERAKARRRRSRGEGG
jgi:hypothetical protein